MGLFGRRSTANVVVDDTLGQESVDALRRPAAAGDVEAVDVALTAADPDLRVLLLEQAVGSHLPLERAQQWTRERPDSPGGWLALAAVLLERGLQARGHDQADQVSTGDTLDFRQAMSDARKALDRAVEADGADPTPWALYLQSDKDPGGPDDLARHLDGLRQRDPFHVRGLREAATLYGQKWYGAPGAARALAEDVDQDAPDGHDARSVVAHVLSEEWLYRSAFTHDREGAIAFVTSDETKHWLRAAADRSVLSTSHQPSVETPAALNAFAFTAGLAGDNGLARELFGQLDGRATTWPWAILGDPAAVYADTRKGA